MPKKGKNAKKKASKGESKTSKAVAKPEVKKSLPKKYEAMFQQILKLYESKKYDKGMKLCKSLLKHHPTHGQTLSMKGLLTYNIDSANTEVAFDLCKKGLALDMKSHVTWHVYGILYRAVDNQRMAIKCYNNALKLDPENQNILRELANLQGQMRDWNGYSESRRKLLTARPKDTQNWGGYSVANHLAGKHQFALHVIDQYVDTLKLDDKREIDPTFELSEIALYRSLLYEAMGDVDGALSALGGKREGHIVDHLGWYQKKGELHLRLGQYDQALHMYKVLLETNPENYDFHRGLQCCLLKYLESGDVRQSSVMPGASNRIFGRPLQDHKYWKMVGCDLPCQDSMIMAIGTNVSMLLQTYDDYRKKFPKVAAFERIPLDFVSGSEYRTRMNTYLKRRLQKCVPSLYSDIKFSFGPDGEGGLAKRDIVTELITTYLDSLKSQDASTFPNEDLLQNPSTYLFSLIFAAQHEDTNGRWSSALAHLETAIVHTPTMLDLYKMKARVYKHAGDFKTATILMNKAREMDFQDRYINTKHVKYLFRSDEPVKAVDIASLFTKDEAGNGESSFVEQVKVFYDMQVIWMEIEEGASRLRTKEHALALKRFMSVHDHYKTFHEDQFDFHNYCMRKSTIRAYLGMVEMVDDLHSKEEYRVASRGIVKCYLAMLDEEESAKNGDMVSKTCVALRTQTANRVRKTQSENKLDKDASGKKKDFDSDGSLAAMDASEKGYLQLSFELCEDLRKFDKIGNDFESAVLRFEVSERIGKPGPMLTSLLDCYRMQPDHWSTVSKFVRLSKFPPSTNAVVASLVQEQLAKILASVGVGNVDEYVSAFVARCMSIVGGGRLSARLEAAELLSEAKYPASTWERDAVAALSLECMDVSPDVAGQRETSKHVREAERALVLLRSLNGGNVEALQAAAAARFPLASAFGATPPTVVLVNGDLSTDAPKVEAANEAGGESKGK